MITVSKKPKESFILSETCDTFDIRMYIVVHLIEFHYNNENIFMHNVDFVCSYCVGVCSFFYVKCKGGIQPFCVLIL